MSEIDWEDYRGNYKLMFKTQGWIQYIEEWKIAEEQLKASIINSESFEQFKFMRGQLELISKILRFEDSIFLEEQQKEIDKEQEELYESLEL